MTLDTFAILESVKIDLDENHDIRVCLQIFENHCLMFKGHVAKQGLNLTLNDESGCCIVFLDRRWIELMSDEKKYNRRTIGL